MDWKRNMTRKYSYIVVSALIAAMTAGCSLQDALADGFLGGIRSTVSALVVDAVAAFSGG